MSQAQVDFILIGDLAVNVYGGDHCSHQLELAVCGSRENSERLEAILLQNGSRVVESPMDEMLTHHALPGATTYDTDLCRLDILTWPDTESTYADLKERALALDFEGSPLYVASADDLICMKRAAGRPFDFGHVAELETIRRLIAKEDGA